MKIVRPTQLGHEQKKQIFELWNNEYPGRLACPGIEDLENYLSNLTGQAHYLLLSEENKINAWAVTFIRENEKWFALIVPGHLHGKGIGTQMLDILKEDEKVLNGWVIDHPHEKKSNGDFYLSPIDFYRKNDFKILSATRLELKGLSAVKIKWEK